MKGAVGTLELYNRVARWYGRRAAVAVGRLLASRKNPLHRGGDLGRHTSQMHRRFCRHFSVVSLTNVFRIFRFFNGWTRQQHHARSQDSNSWPAPRIARAGQRIGLDLLALTTSPCLDSRATASCAVMRETFPSSPTTASTLLSHPHLIGP